MKASSRPAIEGLFGETTKPSIAGRLGDKKERGQLAGVPAVREEIDPAAEWAAGPQTQVLALVALKSRLDRLLVEELLQPLLTAPLTVTLTGLVYLGVQIILIL